MPCRPFVVQELDGTPSSGHVLTGEILAEHDGVEAIDWVIGSGGYSMLMYVIPKPHPSTNWLSMYINVINNPPDYQELSVNL